MAKANWRLPISTIRNYCQEYFLRIIRKRTQVTDTYILHRKNLYIFPTLTGGAFLVLTLVIWLIGTNYQNNLILALAYMQISLFIIVILNTYNNLSGLEVRMNGVKNAILGESVVFELAVVSPNRIGTHHVVVVWRSTLLARNAKKSDAYRLFDFELGTSQIIDVTAQSERRGYFQPEFLLLESIFPMGLLKCWTWLRFDTKAIIYPVPMMCGFPQSRLEKQDDDGGEGLMIKGDDFYGFSQYKAGDSIKHIAWSLYAREQGLQTKQYVASVSQDIWLKWSDFYRGDTEVCLSNMCYWAMQFHKQFQPFGLDIANNKIPISVGDSHLTQVLIALALYPGGDVKA